MCWLCCFFFKQKTAYEMRISDWSSDVCSSDLGVKSVESKSIQGNALIKITFHEGTDMSQAAAEVAGYVSRSRAFMPPGTVPPFVTRFDAGSVPVGQLVFTSETRTLGEIQDLALSRVRRSEEHTSELQSLMRISYAVFCLKKNNHNIQKIHK